MDAAYDRLAIALDKLANGFPRTPSSAELRLLAKVFSPTEAAVAAALTSSLEPAVTVAARARLPVAAVAGVLAALAGREVILCTLNEGEPRFSLVPFLVGVFETHMLASRDAEFALLFEEYLSGGGAAGIMAPEPAIHRTLPARNALKEEWVLPYEDVRQLILGATSFRLQDCVCRLQQDKLGARRCNFPLETCLLLSANESAADEFTISREQALALLDRAEEVGLVHTVSNVVEGIGYICNCCGCCCELLRGINEWGIERSVAQASYYARIDQGICTDCRLCIERCQVNAITAGDAGLLVDRNRCIGCGLCVTGCPETAARLLRKPEDEILPPPLDLRCWEEQRLRARADPPAAPS